MHLEKTPSDPKANFNPNPTLTLTLYGGEGGWGAAVAGFFSGTALNKYNINITKCYS